MEFIERRGPCFDCSENEQFSFFGCSIGCQKFLEHLKKVFSEKTSPCKDLRCGVPGSEFDKTNSEVCLICPLPVLYSESLGKGPVCALGKGRKISKHRYYH